MARKHGTAIDYAVALAESLGMVARRWDPATGCRPASEGCRGCWSAANADIRGRQQNPKMQARYGGLTYRTAEGRPVWTGEIRINEDQLPGPLKAKGRVLWVVGFETDLWSGAVPDAVLDRIFATAALRPADRFLFLTKHPEQMRTYVAALMLDDRGSGPRGTAAVNAALLGAGKTWGECGSTSTYVTTCLSGSGALEPYMLRKLSDGVEQLVRAGGKWIWVKISDAVAARVPDWMIVGPGDGFGWGMKLWPVPNVWLGCTVENQARADERRDAMAALAMSGWRTWASHEPALGAIDWKGWDWLDWLVTGGEAGKDSRPMHPDWARADRDWCGRQGIPWWFKQWGDSAPIEQVAGLDGRRYRELEEWVEPAKGCYRVGKRAAGHLLDGREHREVPDV